MKHLLTHTLLSSIFCILFACNSTAPSKNKDLEIVNYEQLTKHIQQKDNILYVVNFWATWCKPCVEELPHFMEVNQTFLQQSNYEMILVSLDNARNAETHVKPFLQDNNIPVKCYILDDIKRMNEWIPATSPNWTGAIPATVFYKNKERLFFIEGQLSKEELESQIKKNI